MAKTQRPTRFSKSTQRRGRATQTRAGQRRIWVLAGVGIALLVVVLLLFRSQSAVVDVEGVMTFDNLPRAHQEGQLTYPQTPPVGGNHNPVWQNCGIYDQPIQNENGVHSLEHGAVWITYQPDLPAQDIEQLRSLVRGRPYTLLSPYPGLPAPVVASAWGVQLKVDSASDSRLAQFIAKYAQGPQTPEPGAPCTGGVGTPISR